MGNRAAAALAALALAVAIPAAGGARDPEQHERLFGGRAYIALRDGSSATGAIYGLVGEFPQLLLVLTDGRRFGIADIELIDFETAGRSHEVDGENGEDWMATFILRDGVVVQGVLIDYRSDGSGRFWLLRDGRWIPALSVARILFR